MPNFVIDIPEKTYQRFIVEASTIENALAKAQVGEGELVPFANDHVQTMSPDKEPWIHVGHDSEKPYRFIGGQWVSTEDIAWTIK